MIKHQTRGNPIRLIYNSGDIYGLTMLTGKCYVNEKGYKIVEYICKCGKIGWTRLSRLKFGSNKTSCGCRTGKPRVVRKKNHRLSYHPIYSIWERIKDRCYNVNFKQYNDYGGRGVTVCDEWVNNPKAFIEWAIENGWKKGLQIDKDIKYKEQHGTDTGYIYSPEYCCFLTIKEQSRHKRSNVYITAFGENKCVADWIIDSRCSIGFGALLHRIRTLGWDSEKAISAKSLRTKV